MPPSIPALMPRNQTGHQFVCYADACSGIPGVTHEATFAAVNAVVARLQPKPEFICFPGDEIQGLVTDEATLRAQWQYWFNHEMCWLDRNKIPLYHTTGNHTTYDPTSEKVYREVMAHLPQNGPTDQVGLTYFVRRGDLLMIFVNTLWSGLGGEGCVETTWLEQTLNAHTDARHKLVFGHHPVYPVNGFSGPYQREIAPEMGQQFWRILVKHQVLAYICSHILAYDVQIHQGVLQILTAGAGTAHRMPEEIEYLHCIQAALDDQGLRYQVLDSAGAIREWLTWPLSLEPSDTWQPFQAVDQPSASLDQSTSASLQTNLVVWRFKGHSAAYGNGTPQTLLCGWESHHYLAPVWVGLRGQEQRLCVLLSPESGRSPHLWMGPILPSNHPFDIQIAIHPGMGPGGLLWRWHDSSPWSSLLGASAWGAERLSWPTHWRLGHDQQGSNHQPFRGPRLHVTWHRQWLQL